MPELVTRSRTHDLKCWPPFFQAISDGDKTFEVRKNDRGFQKGDHLILREWNPTYNYGSGAYTGQQLDKIVTYVLQGGAFGIEPAYCVMGLADWYVDASRTLFTFRIGGSRG